MARELMIYNGALIASATWAQSKSQPFDLTQLAVGAGIPKRLSIQVPYVNATTAGKTFTVLSQPNDTLTMTAHGQVTGSKGQCTTTGGLPTGLSTSTDYFVIVVDANTVKLATSLALAVAGTAVDITGAGTGTQTFTPTTSTGNVIKLQASNELLTFTGVNSNWVDVTTSISPARPAATVTVATTAGSALWEILDPSMKYLNLQYTPSAGQITFSGIITAFGMF